MILNARGLEYPLNLYCDISEFKEEDEARCYYYHKTADRLPPDIFETMEYLLKEYFNGRDGIDLVRGIYEREEKMPENETARTVISRFFRDMLYYPRYNEVLNFGNNPDKLKESEEKRQAFIKEQFKGRENVFMPDLKKQVKIKSEHQSKHKRYYPDYRRLNQIVFKRFKVVFCNIAFFIADKLKTGIVKCRKCCPCRNNRNTEYYRKNINPKQIRHLTQPSHQGAVYCKKLTHYIFNLSKYYHPAQAKPALLYFVQKHHRCIDNAIRP